MFGMGGSSSSMSDLLNEMFGNAFQGDDSSGSSFRSSQSMNFEDMFGEQDQEYYNQQETMTERYLPCTLEELYTGCQKRLRIRDEIIASGFKIPIERIVTIDIIKGWKNGTKLIFSATRQFPKSIAFIIKEEKHRYYIRVDNDLIWKCRLSNRQVKNGVMIRLPLLDGTIMNFDTKDLEIQTGYKRVFKGLGMPISSTKGGGSGDLIVIFEVTTLPV